MKKIFKTTINNCCVFLMLLTSCIGIQSNLYAQTQTTETYVSRIYAIAYDLETNKPETSQGHEKNKTTLAEQEHIKQAVLASQLLAHKEVNSILNEAYKEKHSAQDIFKETKKFAKKELLIDKNINPNDYSSKNRIYHALKIAHRSTAFKANIIAFLTTFAIGSTTSFGLYVIYDQFCKNIFTPPIEDLLVPSVQKKDNKAVQPKDKVADPNDIENTYLNSVRSNRNAHEDNQTKDTRDDWSNEEPNSKDIKDSEETDNDQPKIFHNKDFHPALRTISDHLQKRPNLPTNHKVFKPSSSHTNTIPPIIKEPVKKMMSSEEQGAGTPVKRSAGTPRGGPAKDLTNTKKNSTVGTPTPLQTTPVPPTSKKSISQNVNEQKQIPSDFMAQLQNKIKQVADQQPIGAPRSNYRHTTNNSIVVPSETSSQNDIQLIDDIDPTSNSATGTTNVINLQSTLKKTGSTFLNPPPSNAPVITTPFQVTLKKTESKFLNSQSNNNPVVTTPVTLKKTESKVLNSQQNIEPTDESTTTGTGTLFGVTLRKTQPNNAPTNTNTQQNTTGNPAVVTTANRQLPPTPKERDQPH